jgi:hypothetical protein
MRPAVILSTLLLMLTTLPASSAAQWLRDNIGSELVPNAINDHGVIVGGTRDGFPFIRHPDGSVNVVLGDLQGTALDINNAGDIVGMTGNRGFLKSDRLGFVDLADFEPVEINNNGVIAGRCGTPASRYPCLWSDGNIVALAGGAPGRNEASGINDAGDVIGRADGGPFIARHDGVRVSLEVPSWADFGWISVVDINNRGQIVGNVGESVAVWDSHGRLIDTLFRDRRRPNDEEFMATAISDAGVVIGIERVITWRLFAWTPGEPRPVYIDPSYHAAAINAHNDIVGTLTTFDTFEDNVGAVWRYHSTPLRITTPNTVSRWGINTRQRLSWTYSGTATHFAIDFSPEPGTWLQIDIVDNKPGNSQNYYRVVTAPHTTTARLRVRAMGDPAAVDVNDADIAIAPASIGIVYPRPGSTRTFGSTERIFYTHNLGARAPVAIDVSGDGGRSWRTVDARAQTNGSTTASFYLTIDVMPTTQARVRVRALDGSGAVGVSQPFSVTAAAVGTISK